MALIERINDDLKTAMKGGDRPRVEVLRFTLASLNAALKEKILKDPKAVLTDEEVVTVLQKETKKRRDAIELFRQGKRDDLVRKEEGDLEMLYQYLPKQLSREEIIAMVNAAKKDGAKDFSSIMKEVMRAAKGRTDGKTVGDVIRDVERT